MIRRRVTVRGRVQGVFFRDSCRSEAVAAGVRGWVRNEPDGSVVAVFEGDAEAVARMCRWCEIGPSHARVSSVDVVDEPPEGLRSFDVGF
jgi:acylphosphatase